jgi:hypothetical protein
MEKIRNAQENKEELCLLTRRKRATTKEGGGGGGKKKKKKKKEYMTHWSSKTVLGKRNFKSRVVLCSYAFNPWSYACSQ